MALFTTLAATDDGNESGIAASTSATSPPTAVQLYTTKSFNFLLNTVSNYGVSSDETTGDVSAEDVPVTPGSSNFHQGHPFAVLSYQAVEVPDVAGPKSGDDEIVALPLGLRKTSIKQGQHLRPNLGVWDCRVVISSDGGESSLVDRLLGSVVGVGGDEKKKIATETFLLAVDLSDPRTVCSAVCSMIESIARHLEATNNNSEEEKEENKGGGTTTLSRLRSCMFGSAASPSSSGNGNDDTAPSANLVLCAIVPNPQGSANNAPSYKEKQSQNLILYHLHKFALEVDCTLCFVRPFERSGAANADAETPAADESGKGADASGSGGASSFGGGMVGTTSVSELSAIVRKLALGVSLVETDSVDDEVTEKEKDAKNEEEEEETEEGEAVEKEEGEEKNESSPTPSAVATAQAVYSPGSHDPDILKGVYLRNASCEGEWDAAKDELNVAIPPPEKATESSLAKNSSTKAGDGEWLAKLHQSVGIVVGAGIDSSSGDGGAGDKSVKTPAKRRGTKKGKIPQGDGQKDAAVSNFFESLLKK